MSDRDRSMLGSKFGGKSNIGFSGLKSKELVQSHLKSIMPSLQGGKKEHEIKYLRVRVQETLESEKGLLTELNRLLNDFCGDHYDCKVFKNTSDILNEEITEQDLYYIFVKEDLAAWGERFTKQELKESDGRKSIFIVEFLRKHKYEQKMQERNKLIDKNRRDPMEKIIYYINSDANAIDELQGTVIEDMDVKLKNKLLREGDRAKSWALANKFKQKKPKKERLYIYIEENLMGKVAGLYKRFRKRNGFKWTQIIKFKDFKDIMESIRKREDYQSEENNIQSSISINPVSRIFDNKNPSGIKSLSFINPGSSLNTNKSAKNLVHEKTEHKQLRNVDKNFIIHSHDFEESDKIYQYVMSQKDNNWQRVIYEDKNYPELDKLVKQIEEVERESEHDQYMKIINAQTLYIITYEGDTETDDISNSYPNNFNNRYVLGYQSEDELLNLLHNYARNDDNFTIVVIDQQGSYEDQAVASFIEKNRGIAEFDNLLRKYKRPLGMNESLSMNSKMSLNEEQNTERFLRSVMEDRDRNFDPFDCYANNYVYLLYRYDKEDLIDNELRKKIADSARLKKTTYQDGNYLEAFLQTIERTGDHAIILTDDNSLREAQEVAKKFNKTSIMNITERKKVKNEIKVLGWGPSASIKEAISNITEKLKVEERSQYQMPLSSEKFGENTIQRRMPRFIEFKDGNNVTVKVSSLETNKDSEVMEDNLNHYFKEEIRIEAYKNPNEIRLVNKAEEPLTFIICRDNEEELKYMKAIAKEERDDLRQEYILFTEDVEKYQKLLFGNPKLERFRFISNSWRKIEEYIIGLYQQLRGIKNDDNDSIYDDEKIHVMYYPEDVHLVNYFNEKYKNSNIYRNVRFHPAQELEWVALEQSPHHLYYVLVDETSGKYTSQGVLNEIMKVQKTLEMRNVAPKSIKMILINKKTGAMRDKFIKGAFEEGEQAINFISNTKLLKPNYDIVKPHIIIDKNSSNWYYFLNKHANKGRYNFHYVENNQEAMNLIMKVRSAEFASEFWYLANNEKDLTKFLESSHHIEQGHRIHGILNNTLPIPYQHERKVLFSNPQPEEVEAFILNAHKRSQTTFSPESLRKRKPILAMSKATWNKVPIDPIEIRKWKEDLGADEHYFNNINELKDYPADRNIFLITDIEESFGKTPDNIWKIIFDSNEKNRTKAHSLVNINPNQREVYNGYYPAEIRHYLKYLRYNIKNPPEKLKRVHNKEMINIYIEDKLTLDPEQINLLKANHSIVNIFSFEGNQKSISNAINHSKSFPNYNHLLIMKKGSANILESMPNTENVNYIIYDEEFRKNGKQVTKSDLLTDEKEEFITYLFNLPENRYEKAKNYSSRNPMKVMYMDNGVYDEKVNELREINKRNNNFVLQPYQRIGDLKQINEKVVVLTDPIAYKKHLDELQYRENITYFILDTDKNKNLAADLSRSEHFLTKEDRELSGYFNNLRRGGSISPVQIPAIHVPSAVDNYSKLNFSRPITFKNNTFDITKIRILPPFEREPKVSPVLPPQPPQPIIILPEFDSNNFIDASHQHMFNLNGMLVEDHQLLPLNINDFRTISKAQPLELKIDHPPGIVEGKFQSTADTIISFPNAFAKPQPKIKERKLAIVYPENREFQEIYRVLESNLKPKSFSSVESFPYNSDYDFEKLSKNESKFMGFDRTVIFITPSMRKYTENLENIKRKMNGKVEYYIFNDNFDQSYNKFKTFLSPYTINRQEIPYINRQDPRFWLSTSLYCVMVPAHELKRYRSINRKNILVSPYTSEADIENQLHRSEEFLIIVCQKKDYNRFKKYPRMSPRCIIVIEDKEELYQDEVPLFRYPRKVLYYGPDALNYLSKTRIPERGPPIKPEPLKVLFYKENTDQEELVFNDDFAEFEKVNYKDSEDLFIQIIEKYKTSNNFKLPANMLVKDLIKLHPKVYLQRQVSYMKKYINEYSTLDVAHEGEFKRSFKTLIKPEQYSHLPVKEYNSAKELKQMLDYEESPCLVYGDENNRDILRIEKEFNKKHLFILMFELSDRWIDKNGRLIESHKLSHPKLATKQTLFTDMFNTEVFDSYNDMGYFYLSNTAHVDKVRNIRFMTREQLEDLFKREINLLMIIFVEETDRSFIPKKFYDPVSDRSQEERVKLIFIKTEFVNHDDILYIKYNEIDPVIKHINRVEQASRTDFCLYPNNKAGNVLWHKFASSNFGYQPKEYDISNFDSAAHDIKGKFRKVVVICQKDHEPHIRTVFDHYSIKSKQHLGSEEEVKFYYLSNADHASFISPYSKINISNIKGSHINLENSDNDDRFETAGHPIDINGKTNASARKLVGSKNMSLEDVIESKNFVLNVNEKLRESFPVGNIYAHNINYFRNLESINRNTPLNQLLITNENITEARNLAQKNPNIFLVYVGDDAPSGKEGNSVVIKESEIHKFINDLEGIQRAGKKVSSNLPHIEEQPSTFKNLDDFKVIRVFYDENVDKDLKKKIFLAALKNKNLRPHLFKNMKELKELMKEEGSLSLLLVSKEPSKLDEELSKENYRVIKNKKTKLLVPKDFNSDIRGLSTILEENESNFENIDKADLNNDVDTLLTIMQNNPEKGRKLILAENFEAPRTPNNETSNSNEEGNGGWLPQQDSDKLRLHSNINFDHNADTLANKEWIKQRLDGGVIVLFIDKNMVDKVEDMRRKYNVLAQEYSHAVNLNNSIREKKDKFTIVLVEPNMLPELRNIKEQYPKTVFVLVNKDRREIQSIDKPNITYEVQRVEEFEPIMGEIYEENEKIKYNDHGKIQSKMDTKKTSYVDNGNSWRLSAGYNNTKSKNAFVFYKEERNKGLLKRVENLGHITFVPYKDVLDAQKKFNTYGGYQIILIANDNDIPPFEDYVLKKKEQTYLIKLNSPEDHRENPKIKKNLLLSAYSEEEIANFLIEKFGDYGPTEERNQSRPKEGKSYAPRYQPNTFGTTPRFTGQKDYVPYKNDPIYSSRGLKSVSRESKMRTEGIGRELSPRVASNVYYNR